MPPEVSDPSVLTALQLGRADALVSSRPDGVAAAALARLRRERAMEVAAIEGVPATALGVAMAHAGVDLEGDRAGRFAADVLEALDVLEADPRPLSAAALRLAWDASERNNTSIGSRVDSDCDLVAAAFARRFDDLESLSSVLEDLGSGSRCRRRLVAFALPHVLQRMYALRFAPRPTLRALDEAGEGSGAGPVLVLNARLARGLDELTAVHSTLSGLKGRADGVIGKVREDARTGEAYVAALASPVLTPVILSRRLRITPRGGSNLLARLEELHLVGRMPPNRLARQIAVCREALDPVAVHAA